MLSEALRLHQNGAYTKAIELYSQLLRINPDSSVAYNMGLAYSAQNNLAQAERSYRQALQLNPIHANAKNNLALILQRQGNLFEAETHLRDLLADDPWNGDVSTNLAGILLQQGRPQMGVSILYPCLKRINFHPIGWDTLGACLQDIGDIETAVGCFHRSHQQDPSNPETLFHLHGALYNDSNPEPALSCLTKANALDPSRWDIQFYLHCLSFWNDDTKVPFPTVGEHLPWKESWNYILQNRTQNTRLFSTTAGTLKHAVSISEKSGLVTEFGVRFGTTLSLLQQYTQQQVHGFDSFEGLPTSWHEVPRGAYSTGGQIPLLGDSIQLHPGWFSSTLPTFLAQHKEPSRLIHIDCDLYSSTIEVLDSLAPQITVGTIIVFDEYIMNPHWQKDEYKAWQEAVHKYNWNYEYMAFSLLSNQAVIRISP
jgi:tetratricopeptide (TPR) repeat protein